jgi:hypothetical protein
MRNLTRRSALAVAVVGLMGISAGRAEAGLTYFDFAFSSPTTGNSGYGTLAATANGDGSYTAVSGALFDNFGVDGLTLVPNPNAPGATTPPNPFFFYDDQLFPGQDPLLDINGLLFGTGGGTSGELLAIFGNDPGAYGIAFPNQTYDFSIVFTLTSVPEPSSIIMTSVGGLMAMGIWRRRRRAKVAA